MAFYCGEAQRTRKVAAFAVILLGALTPAAIAEEERTRKAVLDIGRPNLLQACALPICAW